MTFKRLPHTKLLVLLDSHALIHRAYHALPDFATADGVPTGALYGLATMLLKIVTEFSPDYIVAAYDRKEKTHRHEVYLDYKGTRKKLDDALITQLNSSREIFEALNIPIYDKAGFEADDVLGTITEDLKNNKDIQIMIASGDMDTLQLVVGEKTTVFTLKKGIKDTILYDEDAVLTRFGFHPLLIPDFKGLRGDPSDNIPGIAGIGEKTATTLITSFGSIEDMYKILEKDEEKIKKAGVSDRIVELLKAGKEEAMFSKMLATIRRDAPIDFKIEDHTFKEGIDVTRAEEIFKKYEFRTMSARLKDALNLMKGAKTEAAAKEKKGTKKKKGEDDVIEKDTLEMKEEATEEEPEAKINEETALMISVVDSSIPKPTTEDMLEVTGETDEEKAKEILNKKIKNEGLEFIYGVEKELSPILKKMEGWGVKIDVPYLKNLSDTYHKTLSNLEKKIIEHAGKEFNIGSPKQLGEILFDKLNLTAKGMKKTAGGARSTKESELLKLKDLHPIVPLILEYRELSKLLTTYIDVIPTLVDKNDRVHTHFIQIGAVTGRMATENPGVQNIPIKSELGRAIRHAFIAEKGYKIVSFDYSQVELRIASILSGDKKLMDIFKEGYDVHTAVAAQVFKVPLMEVTSEMRRKAKIINFGILYGMGINALRTNLGGERKEAEEFYDNYFATFTTLASYLEGTKDKARKDGFTTTFFGRRRYFPDIKSHLPFMRASAERMAINAPIQGTQADIIKIAMCKINEQILKKDKTDSIRMLLQVHDELVFEIKEGDIASCSKKIKEIMEDVFTKEKSKGIPIIANGRSGNNWGELTSI